MALCNPLVSVIIPAYNAERFIAETLNSVTAQSYQKLEILVVDDGSSDSTVDIVKTYMDIDARIVLIQQNNAGVAAARNRAIEQASGEFIAPIDADDVWFPECIEAQLSLMTEPEVGMVYTWSVFINELGQLTKTCQSSLWQGRDYLPLIYCNLPGNASCVLLRRSYVQRIGGYDSSYRTLDAQGCEDWDLYLRLAEQFEVRVVPRLLVGYRQVRGSMSMDLDRMQRSIELVMQRFAQRHPEINPILYQWNRSNFAYYLAAKCNRVGNYGEVVAHMQKALAFDYCPLLQPGFYKLGIGAFLKIVFHPITSMVWPDHQSWLVFKEDLGQFLRSLNPLDECLSLENLQHQQFVMKKRFPWYQYEQFLEWRYKRIRNQINESLQVSKDIEGLAK